MKEYIASLEGTHRYSQSRAYSRDVPPLEKEKSDAYEERTWRNRCHFDDNGEVYIPPTAFKEALTGAASYLSIKIPGKRNATYTKHFVAGLIVSSGIRLGIKKENVKGEWLYLNADGKKGGNTRVWRCMPYVETWKGDLSIHVMDEVITKDTLLYHLQQAGVFVGIGRFRPQKGGYYGRFIVKELVEV